MPIVAHLERPSKLVGITDELAGRRNSSALRVADGDPHFSARALSLRGSH
jgi:hypothetical protein